MGKAIKVVLAEDQDLIRSSFRVLIDSQADFDVVGEARTGKEAVRLTADLSPDVVLMDIQMPELDGLGATRAICATCNTRVIVLTTFDLDEYIYGALHAGASGFLLKNCTPADLLHAIRVVAAGDGLLSPEVTRRVIAEFARIAIPLAVSSAAVQLTARELDIVALVADGRSNAEIADRLHLATATVKSYVSRLLTKLDARDRAQLVIYAYEHGIVQPARIPTARTQL